MDMIGFDSRPATARASGSAESDGAGLEPIRDRLATLGRPHTPADVADAMRAEGLIVSDSAVIEMVESLRRNSIGAGALVFGCSITPQSLLAAGLTEILSQVIHGFPLGDFVILKLNGDITIMTHRSEMGQGINTKVMQVVAHELGVELGRVRATATNTSKVSNTSATAASIFTLGRKSTTYSAPR